MSKWLTTKELLPGMIFVVAIVLIVSILIYGAIFDHPKVISKSPTMEFIEDINKHLIPSYNKEGK